MGPRPHLIIAQSLPHSSVADAKLCGNLAQTCTLRTQSQYFILAHDPARATKLFAAGPRIADARTDTLADQIALKLGDR